MIFAAPADPPKKVINANMDIEGGNGGTTEVGNGSDNGDLTGNVKGNGGGEFNGDMMEFFRLVEG